MRAAREVLLERRMEGVEGFLFTNTLGRPRERRAVQRPLRTPWNVRPCRRPSMEA